MTIKLLKVCRDTPIGSVVEVDDIVGAKMLAGGEAIWYDAEVERVDAIRTAAEQVKAVRKSVNIVKKENPMSELVLGKMFQHIASKSITGMSETGSAADGGALVITGLAELAPLVFAQSVAYNKCRKIPVPKGCNAMKVPVSKGSQYLIGTAPVGTVTAEGVAYTPTKLQLDPRTLTMTKIVIPIPVTSELLEDTASMDAWVRAEMVSKLAQILDAQVLVGSGAGYTAVNGDTNYCSALTVSATPTAAELTALVNSISGFLKPEWYGSKTMIDLVMSTFLTSANIAKGLVDPVAKTIFGVKYNIMPALGAGDLVIGDFSQYTVIESVLGDRLSVSSEVRFSEDEVVFKLVHRGAGAATTYLQTGGDALKTGAFAEKA